MKSSPTLFIEINKFEFFFSVCNIVDNQKIEIIHSASVPIEGIIDNKISDYELLYNLIKKNIYNIEQKINFVFKEIIIILDNLNLSLINFTGFKNLNGSQLVKENITFILNSLKSEIIKFEKKKTILHIFNSKFILDHKNTENLPIGLFGDFYSHELSFFLIDSNDLNNLKNIFNKCNLRINKILSKSFVEGISLINNNQNLDTFFKIEIDKKNCRIIFFENCSLKFEQNFKFGSDLIIQDISKIVALDKEIVNAIISSVNFQTTNPDDIYIGKDFFKKSNFRKIKKQLFHDIATARIHEILELIFYKNINLVEFLKDNKKIFLTIYDKIIYDSFKQTFIKFNKTKNLHDLELIKKNEKKDLIENINKLVQFGWKSEAVPIVNEKKSIITKLFDLLFK